MTFQEFRRTCPDLFLSALERHGRRIAELADRDDPAAIGSLVLHGLDSAKFDAERRGDQSVLLLWPPAKNAAADEPAMLRRQAD